MNRNIAYWVVTGLFCTAFTGGGFAHLLHLESIATSMNALGYPPYVMTILGVAKLLGVVALLAPGRPLLKEWAYAGFTFNLLGATISHVAAGDPLAEWAGPVFLLALGATSYHMRPASRRLDTHPQALQSA
jgi:hypothetical protein